MNGQTIRALTVIRESAKEDDLTTMKTFSSIKKRLKAGSPNIRILQTKTRDDIVSVKDGITENSKINQIMTVDLRKQSTELLATDLYKISNPRTSSNIEILSSE